MYREHCEVCVVGMGPRGLSVLERLCANERAARSWQRLTVHVIDDAEPGAGAVWRTDQSRHLLMNTVASQITLYTDDSVRIEGPVEYGPSLYEWARGFGVASGAAQDPRIRAEVVALGPDSYPTRALYGCYLRDCFQRTVATAPAHVEVRIHRSRAVAMADTYGMATGPQGIRLRDGTRLDRLDAIVLALGHTSVHPTSNQARVASLARIHRLCYIQPANPADVHLDEIADEPVLLRGLGLSFFDYMALLTVGRGGTFVRADGRCRYVRSGDEPRLYATSRRGLPYHARGENEKGTSGRHEPRILTGVHALALRAAHPLRFGAQVWPLIAREVEIVYYEALLRAVDRQADSARFVAEYLALPLDSDPVALIDAYGLADRRWDWQRIVDPLAHRRFDDRNQFRSWLLDHLASDVAAARAGNVSGPMKAALDVLRDLRNEIRLAIDHGSLDGGSHRDELDGWYTPLNAFLSIGPPVSRIEEMIALLEAGVLELTGPGTTIGIDVHEPAFVAWSSRVPGPPVRSKILIEARLPEPDLRRTADPLLRHLLATGQCADYRIPHAGQGPYETGGLAVTERPYHLVDAAGRPHPRRFAFGVPTEGVHWVTAAGIRPGVNSVTLVDSDAIARAVLGVAPVAPGRVVADSIIGGADLAQVVV
ncbi:FAD/NAD(P)-binding protein [Nocardia sp. NPDC051052]|uniref:FAD/NAD(P)-binding protein n=1 Tax=Nocardia sp. NPDC051052 TaxID=3364322 RepID=UPI0037B755A3